MDYDKIGQRVRFFRRARGLSQEELAEKINISVPHMSHIETGNTKLSLPVFVALTQALGIRADELLHDPTSDHESIARELASLLDSCTPAQARCVADIARAAKTTMERNL